MQDYITRYGMEFNPFIKNTHDIIMETDDYRELKIHLDYLLAIRALALSLVAPDVERPLP